MAVDHDVVGLSGLGFPADSFAMECDARLVIGTHPLVFEDIEVQVLAQAHVEQGHGDFAGLRCGKGVDQLGARCVARRARVLVGGLRGAGVEGVARDQGTAGEEPNRAQHRLALLGWVVASGTVAGILGAVFLAAIIIATGTVAWTLGAVVGGAAVGGRLGAVVGTRTIRRFVARLFSRVLVVACRGIVLQGCVHTAPERNRDCQQGDAEVRQAGGGDRSHGGLVFCGVLMFISDIR